MFTEFTFFINIKWSNYLKYTNLNIRYLFSNHKYQNYPSAFNLFTSGLTSMATHEDKENNGTPIFADNGMLL